jgi:acetolactate synthase-1/2/3 large subunit
VSIQTESVLGLAALETEIDRHRAEHGDAWQARYVAMTGQTASADLSVPVVGGTVRTAAVGAALNSLLAPEDIVVEEATTNSEVLRESLDRTRPGTYFRSGGSGLGWGLPGAFGVKLARSRSRVVAIVGDGAFLFGSPVAALWAMHSHRAPVLTIVLQNGGYAASRAPVFRLFPDGASAKSNSVVGTLIDTPPRLAAIAQACHAYGATVQDEQRLLPTLRAACKRVDGGQSAVVVVHVSSPWI